MNFFFRLRLFASQHEMMLSRLALRSGDRSALLAVVRTSPAAFSRLTHGEVATDKDYKLEPLQVKEHPERDLVNFPRFKRPEYPGKVRWGFVPEEWFTFFYNKTGVTGPYAFAVGLTTYLVSKEIYVLDHEYYAGLSLFIMALYGIKKFGPKLAAYLDKEVDAEENELVNTQNENIQILRDAIAEEEKAQLQAKSMTTLIQAKRENLLLQLESAFRERQMMVYEAVKKRLDFQLEKQNSQRRLEQRHMVNWIVSSVIKSITPQQEKEALQKCIADLKSLASKAKAM